MRCQLLRLQRALPGSRLRQQRPFPLHRLGPHSRRERRRSRWSQLWRARLQAA